MNKKDNAAIVARKAASAANEYLEDKDDHVEVGKNDESGNIIVYWHSPNNSFPIKDTGVKADDTDLEELERLLDIMGIAHCW